MEPCVAVPVFDHRRFEVAVERGWVPYDSFRAYMRAVDNSVTTYRDAGSEVVLCLIDPDLYEHWCIDHQVPIDSSLSLYAATEHATHVPVLGSAAATVEVATYLELIGEAAAVQGVQVDDLSQVVHDKADHMWDVLTAYVRTPMVVTVTAALTGTSDEEPANVRVLLRRSGHYVQTGRPGDRHVLLAAFGLSFVTHGHVFTQQQLPEICPANQKPFELFRGWEITNGRFRPMTLHDLARIQWENNGHPYEPGPEVTFGVP